VKKFKKLIIFDLDGVLIDSSDNMKFALKLTSEKLNINLKFNQYKKYIGLPFEEIMKNMGVKENINLIKKNYIFYSQKNLHKINISKERLSTLKKLKKFCDLAVFTSKDKKRTRLILSKYKLFNMIVTSDDVKKGKPNPNGLNKIIKKLKSKKTNVFYVGDSYYDYKAALKAKIKYFHALWGYYKIKNYKKVNNLKNLKQILNFIK
tara:strand:- start:178 stop:795 length:618 start_codon:yes stop_codon:yes gene_type:complete